MTQIKHTIEDNLLRMTMSKWGRDDAILALNRIIRNQKAQISAKDRFQEAFSELIKDKNPLTFSDIYIGMSVIDSDGDVGVVTSMKDAHNIEVKGEGMTGLYCVDTNCKEYDGYVLYEYSR